VYATDLGSRGMQTIYGLSGLQSLQLHFWGQDKNRPEEFLSFEGQLQQLVLLRLRAASLSDRELQAISGKCPHLEELELNHCYEISDAGMVGVHLCGDRTHSHQRGRLRWSVHQAAGESIFRAEREGGYSGGYGGDELRGPGAQQHSSGPRGWRACVSQLSPLRQVGEPAMFQIQNS